MNFTDLRLAEPIVRAVSAEGYTEPTPIQSKAIPEILAGRDVLGCARTGTGKTAAFALPVLDFLAGSSAEQSSSHNTKHRRRAGTPRVLILAPTRELASQICDSFRTYGRNLPLRSAVVFGGVSQGQQVRQLRAGVDVLAATPGRLLDLIEQGHIDLGAIEVLVLDEADRMLDMGFIRDIRKIIDQIPAQRQTLLFSATMPEAVRQFAATILHNPVSVQAPVEASTAGSISQRVYMVEKRNKRVLLERLVLNQPMGRTLVFTRTRRGADRLVRSLRQSGVQASAIHGNKSQNDRTRTLNSFKDGRIPILVATDVASRGIDVDEITHVVNFDIPNVAETYVHRIGRTARAGATGTALSFCDRDELSDLRAIERLIRTKLDVMKNDDDLATVTASSSSATKTAGNGRQSNRRQDAQRSRSKHPLKSRRRGVRTRSR